MNGTPGRGHQNGMTISCERTWFTIMPHLFSMKCEDDSVDLGDFYLPSPETLRVFGASYMMDKETSGPLKILDPNGGAYASFDVWQNQLILAADVEA